MVGPQLGPQRGWRMLDVHRRGARNIVALPPRALADEFDSFIVAAVGESCERGSTLGIVAKACASGTGGTGGTSGTGCTGRTGCTGNPAIKSRLGGTVS